MSKKIAIVGAGVSGLTCAAVLAERDYEPHIFASRDAESSTSGAAAAIWYPYDAEPPELAVAWGMISYGRFLDLSLDSSTGISLIEFRIFSKSERIEAPTWANALIHRQLGRDEILPAYTSGFAMRVPLIDASLYLPWLRTRVKQIHYGDEFTKFEDAGKEFDLIVNCTGIGARSLTGDTKLEPHRGQIVIVPKHELPYAFVSEDEPLTYVIPRTNDCVFGGSNDRGSYNTTIDRVLSQRIVNVCSDVLGIEAPKPIGDRVGLRPFRRTGVRIDSELLDDGRRVIHNYGHGGAGFSLSWGCAQKVYELVERYRR